MAYPSTVVSQSRESALTTNKVLRNTYLLLGATLAFSAATAGYAMATDMPYLGPWITLGVYIVLAMATAATRNSGWGLVCIFGLTGFLGLTLGPILNFYLKMPGGSEIITTALGVTALTFVGLSAYAIKSERNFSFMRGFLMVGIISVFLLSLVAVFFNLSTMSLAISGVVVFLMAALILYQTSEIIHGGETNYIMATVTLYMSIYNMFTSLLHLLGAASDD